MINMRKTKITVAAASLRVIIMFGLIIVFLAAATVCIIQGPFAVSSVADAKAKNGVFDMQKLPSGQNTFFLNGVWEYYPNVFETGESFDGRLLERSKAQLVSLPLLNIKQASGPSTYRLKIKTAKPFDKYAFYMEHYNQNFAIYVNGQKVNPLKPAVDEELLYSISNCLFYVDDAASLGNIEIIVSANSDEEQALLYQNKIVFGPTVEVVDYVSRVWRDNTFLIGIIIVIVTVGLVFVLMRSRFDFLTTAALFDTLLVIRILLGYSVATYFISKLFPWLMLDSVDFVRLQYTAFFFTGIFGCKLSQSIFDSKKELPAWPIKLQMIVCFLGGIFTLLFFEIMPEVCIGLLVVILFASFLIVTWHVIILIKKKRLTGYILFQIVKSYYVGGIMIIDIVFPQIFAYNAFVYAYVIFLCAHLSARIIDSNASYREVEKLNSNLEQIIAERTKELTDTNQILSELSVRDPLTQAYNRLYFTQKMEDALCKQPMQNIYLCMFDLDHFKSINDRFGHIAGDDQLKFVVKEANKILDGRGSVSRVGGEEFTILFEGESKATVTMLTEQIRRRLEEDAAENEKRTTASFGVVGRKESSTAKEIMKAADKCLYTAKKMGRNCVVFE